MAAHFLDSSAAVKLYVAERGSSWLAALLAASQPERVFLMRVAAVEIGAALFRRVTAGSLSLAQATAALATLRRDLSRAYEVLELTPVLTELALEMAERHRLRGYDCVQLAAAVSTQRRRMGAGLSPLVLVSADTELNTAARSEGLSVEDPNTHP